MLAVLTVLTVLAVLTDVAVRAVLALCAVRRKVKLAARGGDGECGHSGDRSGDVISNKPSDQAHYQPQPHA